MTTIAAARQITPVGGTTAPATTPGADGAASDDFIQALTQALSAAAPASPVVATQALTLSTPVSETDTALDEVSAQEAAASVAAFLNLPWMPQPTALPAPQGDPLEMLGVTGGVGSGSSRQSGLDAALQNTLAALTQGDSSLEDADVEVPASLDPGIMLNPSAEKPVVTTNADKAGLAAFARPLQHNVGSQAWSDELGTRVAIMAERGQQTASLRLSPEHLGPLEVRISIRDDQASVWFGAAHADTRAAIEHALPRLREMFAAQGMSLTDAGVSREPPREQPPAPRRPTTSAEPVNEAPVTITSIHRLGLVDAYV